MLNAEVSLDNFTSNESESTKISKKLTKTGGNFSPKQRSISSFD